MTARLRPISNVEWCGPTDGRRIHAVVFILLIGRIGGCGAPSRCVGVRALLTCMRTTSFHLMARFSQGPH